MGVGNGVSAHYATSVVAGKTLETKWVMTEQDSARTIVLLHEALGSLALWKDFPEQLAEQTNSNVLVYSRYGHGVSEVLSEQRTIDYIQYEGEVVLPELLNFFGISDPVLLGHSDGASIAITYAGKYHDRVSGLILMAPHVFVEDVTVKGVLDAGIAYDSTDLRQKLSRYHRDPDGVFLAWHAMWTDPKFRNWSIESYLPSICCPTLLIQGEKDEYGTVAQLQAIRSQVVKSELCVLAGCGHSPYREMPRTTLHRISQFMTGLPWIEICDKNVADAHAERLSSFLPASPARPCRQLHRSMAAPELPREAVAKRRSNLS